MKNVAFIAVFAALAIPSCEESPHVLTPTLTVTFINVDRDFGNVDSMSCTIDGGCLVHMRDEVIIPDEGIPDDVVGVITNIDVIFVELESRIKALGPDDLNDSLPMPQTPEPKSAFDCSAALVVASVHGIFMDESPRRRRGGRSRHS